MGRPRQDSDNAPFEGKDQGWAISDNPLAPPKNKGQVLVSNDFYDLFEGDSSITGIDIRFWILIGNRGSTNLRSCLPSQESKKLMLLLITFL